MKKGEIAIEQVIIVIVAILVIVVVGYFAWNFFTGKADVVANNLPLFGQTNNPIKSIQEVRYDVINDNVQYYDGTTWHDFDVKTGTANLGDKTVSKTDLKIFFNNYYFSKDNRPSRQVYSNSDFDVNILGVSKGASLDSTEKTGFYNFPGTTTFANSYMNAWFKYLGGPYANYNRGDVVSSVTKNKQIYGFLFVSFESKIIFEGVDGNGNIFDTNPFDNIIIGTIIFKSVVWRDAILKVPATISYKIDNKDTSASFCLKQYGSYLVIEDLTKPTTSNTCP